MERGARFEDLTTEEIAAARGRGAAALLPVGSIEPHGPHLPLSTDILIAEATAHRAAVRLRESDIEALVLPAIAYSTVAFSAGFAGAIGPGEAASRQALVEVLAALLDQGFRAVALVNAHLEPAHIAALRAAVQDAGARTGRAPLFPDVTRRAHAARLTEEFRSGACHAGRYETSLVMAIRPDLVKEEVRRALPPVPISLVEAIGRGKTTFLEAGIERAYCGDPAAATAEEGRSSLEVLAAIVAEDVLKGFGEGEWPIRPR